MGIAASMSEGEVASRLLAGSCGLVSEPLRGEFGSLRVSRLHSKRRAAARGGAQSGAQSDEVGAGELREAGPSQGGAGDAIPTRSVRVYMPGQVLERFLSLGYMKLGGWWCECGPTPLRRPTVQCASGWGVTRLSPTGSLGPGAQGHRRIRDESPFEGGSSQHPRVAFCLDFSRISGK